MDYNRARVVDDNLVRFLQDRAGEPADRRRPSADDLVGVEEGLLWGDVLEVLESMMVSRHLDFASREMRGRGKGFYTIGSAGHEANAVVGRLTRHTDIAFLHYRSGAFMAERARKVPGIDLVRDTLLGVAASRDDPVAGGRHKVWGSVPLWVPPQTSTVASHLPKGVGAAFALERARSLRLPSPIPADSVVVCSFGDAGANHAAAQTAFNAAAWAAQQRLPVPVLFVCEDNGLGISVATPPGWIRECFGGRPHILYERADGLDLLETWRATARALDSCRRHRAPVFLHLEVVRLLGHAGSDPEWEYRSEAEIEEAESRDPLLRAAGLVVDRGPLDAARVLDLYESVRGRVREAAAAAEAAPKLATAGEVTAPLAPLHPREVATIAGRVLPEGERRGVFGDSLPEEGPPRHMASLLGSALHDLMLQYPEAVVFGEDVARKGGVYHVTAGLWKAFGAGRVFNTLLDETTILGMAVGAAHLGFLPLPEIQYLAYLYNALDQLRGEAGSLSFFSRGAWRNPMVVRIAAWAYQKGFGGHFHNDNGIAGLREVPGLVIASPARGDDAVGMLRTCAALARADGRVVVFLEPIALYMVRDLYEEGDRGWTFPYPVPGIAVPLGEGRVYPAEGEGPEDLTILTWSNGLYMSLRAARRLCLERGVRARVADLRWLQPVNEEFVLEQAAATGRVLVVDEGRHSGGVGEGLLAILAEKGSRDWPVRRLAGEDTYLPLGDAALLVLPTEDRIVEAAEDLLSGSRPETG